MSCVSFCNIGCSCSYRHHNTTLFNGHIVRQAPGDGDERCTDDADAPTYPDNEKTLMDSYHYLQLLPGNGSGNIIPGAVWNDRSVDGNDEMNTINPTYVR